MSQYEFSSVELPTNVVNGLRFSSGLRKNTFEEATKYRAHDDDVLICTYPKSGTTWMQYIMCYLLHYDEFDGTMSKMKKLCPFMDHDGTGAIKPGMMYKKHLPFDVKTFNVNAKYIVVMRNPRDVAVSYYHFVTLFPRTIPDLPEGADWFRRFAELFVKGEVWYGDYMEWHLNWLEGARKHGKPENFLFVVYEKMKKHPREELIRIANFLGGKAAELIKDEKIIVTILEKTHVNTMKKDVNESMTPSSKNENGDIPKVVQFVRKGTVGDHVNYFTPEISKMFDDYIESNPRNREVMRMFAL